MDVDEVVGALRCCNRSRGHRCSECPVFSRYDYRICKATVDRAAIDLIESLQAQLAERDKELKDLQKEVASLAIESIEREKTLAKLEAEVTQLWEAQRWVSVSERLPEDAFGCLLIVEDDDYWGEPRKVLLPYFAGYDGEQWNDGDGCRVRFEVTHWMELPTPPEEGAGK